EVHAPGNNFPRTSGFSSVTGAGRTSLGWRVGWSTFSVEHFAPAIHWVGCQDHKWLLTDRPAGASVDSHVPSILQIPTSDFTRMIDAAKTDGRLIVKDR